MRALILPLLVVASPAAAQLRAVPDQPASASAARSGVDVFLINDSDSDVAGDAPARIEVTTADAARIALVPSAAAPDRVAAHGFARVRYLPAGVVEVVAAPPAEAPPEPPNTAAVDPVARTETVLATSAGTSAGFLDRFRPHEPTYGVFGLANAGAKLQFSVALQPFGGDGIASHIRVAYTQTMFWAIDRPSGPFRQTVYSPEAFVDVPVGDSLTLAGGYRHDSNGRGWPLSIDVNRIFVRAAKSFDLGNGWSAELIPQAWFYIDHAGAPGFDRYWGYSSLKATIGRRDGIKLAVMARGNPGTGKGGAELFASYPLAGIGRDGGIGLYLFGQAYTGYGEALDQYRINDSHARLGISLTR